jgi:hypothetical protein
MGVWVVGLLIFYLGGSCGAKAIGEAWTAWSFLELFGFMILLLGTFSYKGLVRIPWVSPEQYELAAQDSEDLANAANEDVEDNRSKEKDVYNLLASE